MNKPKIPSVGQMRHELFVKGGEVLPHHQREKNKAAYLKDSKVKDVMYHGTNEDFSQFYPYAKPKTQGGENLHGSGAMFFTPDRELANKYSGANKTDSTHPKMKETGGYHAWPPESIHGGNVMPVHLNMTNPLVVDAEGKMYHQVEHHILGAKKKGHDSVILRNVVDAPGSAGSLQTHKHDAHIVFNPKQIKSAIGNRGTYDTTNPDITKAKGGIISQLRRNGKGVSSELEAMRRMSQGHRVFVTHEQDEHPREVRSVSEFHGYVPDQIYTVHPKHFMQKKADGGYVQGKTMTPDLAKMRIELAQNRNPIQMDSIGVNEAMDVEPKIFMSPTPLEDTKPSVGGTQVPKIGPMGGIDMNPNQPGQQLMPAPQQAPGGLPSASANPSIPQGPTPPMGNMLSMTPQGQDMQAMDGGQPQPQSMASGGRAKPKFAIAPSKAPAPTPEHFTPYDHENPTISSLAKAFDEAIAHHLSLHPEARAANSIRASEALAEHIGRNSNNGAKDLLGKNAKLIKSEKGEEEAIKLPDGRGVETTGLALAPAFEKGKFNTCPNSHSCKAECLGKTSGNYFKLGGGKDLSEFKGPRLNSLRKTLGFIHDPHSFAVKLHDEISDAKAIAAQNNNHLGVRLNVLSDINPRVHKSIIEAHPDVTFYDYTKNNTNPIAPNHHYTYSSTGVSQHGVDNPHSNWKQMRRRLNGGDNVAMAFTHKEHLPEYIHDEETGKKYRVANGDTHDFRPLDLQPEGEEGVIVGLKNKKATGKMNEAHLDSNGFFVHYDPALKMSKSEKTGSPIYARDKKGNTIAQNKDVRIKPQTGGMIPITNDDGGKA